MTLGWGTKLRVEKLQAPSCPGEDVSLSCKVEAALPLCPSLTIREAGNGQGWVWGPVSTRTLYLMLEEPFFFLPDRKRFKTCTYSLGIKSFHPSANKFPAPILHVRWKGKRSVEHGPEGRAPSTQDLIRGASAQELLAQCLSRSLLLEKEESKR